MHKLVYTIIINIFSLRNPRRMTLIDITRTCSWIYYNNVDNISSLRIN